MPLVLFAVLLVVLLAKAVRIWQEIHDVEEPATPGELLASLEDAHAAGELDDDEIAQGARAARQVRRPSRRRRCDKP